MRAKINYVDLKSLLYPARRDSVLHNCMVTQDCVEAGLSHGVLEVRGHGGHLGPSSVLGTERRHATSTLGTRLPGPPRHT